MAKNYKPDENGNTKCIECGRVIHPSDSYHWVIFIHKGCYEKLLSHTHTNERK